MTATRQEQDGLGPMEIPDDARWGIHTARARANFHLSDRLVPPSLVRALACVKQAACQANAELGYLDAERAGAIEAACLELREGRWMDQFPLDAVQGGAGTSLNMNVNEVLANLALDRLGGVRGDYARVHPIEHVNLHQSTNDVYPTALKVAAIEGLRAAASGFEALQGALQRKEQAFGGIVCMGRTEGQDAVPMTLGAMFSSWAEAFARDRWRAFKGEERLRVVNLGGTAVGTGLTAPRRYIFLVIEKLRALTGYGLARGENPVEQTANADPLVEVSGLLKTAATNFIKLARDLRFLQSQGEIRLPACQAGSSIMPGKINPVRLEAAIAAGLQMKANDSLLTDAVSLGTLQIHEFMPTIAYALLESLQLAERTCRMLAPHVDGIEADEDVCRGRVDRSPTLVTALLPAIGYRRAEVLARALAASGRADVRAFLSEQLGAACVDEALSPRRLMALGYRDDG